MKINDTLKGNRKIQAKMTSRVIDLHQSGYEADFIRSNEQLIICCQNNRAYKPEELAISFTGKFPSGIRNEYRYLHTVESSDGLMGMLVTAIDLNGMPSGSTAL